MLGDNLTTRAYPLGLLKLYSMKTFEHQALSKDPSQRGYTMIEAIVAASITALISAGLWQLVAATSKLAHASFIEIRSDCDTPKCMQTDSGVACSCGRYTYFILR